MMRVCGMAAHTGTNNDSVIPHNGVSVAKAKSTCHKAGYMQSDTSSSEDEEDSVSLKILQQLKRMSSRLKAVEVQVAEFKSDKQVKRRRTAEQCKISSCSDDFVKD